jgi:hypothetical protein
MELRGIEDPDRSWLREVVASEWGLPVVSVSGAYDPSTLPGFVAEDTGRQLGVVTYHLSEGECEVVTLNSLQEGCGVGTALLAAVKRLADLQLRRLWLITTNENINAIGFYQRRGMDMRALHRDFVEEVRLHKPGLDDHPAGLIPFRHAIEFSY